MLSADSFFLADAIGRAQGLEAWERLALAAAIESTEKPNADTADYADESEKDRDD